MIEVYAMESVGATVIPVIISGGSGSRLWPLSREARPKPFIKLPDGQNLLQKTILRAFCLPNHNSLTMVTREELFFQSQNALFDLEPNAHAFYILEPISRNTAPAILMAALSLAKEFDQQTILAILPADHLIVDDNAFVRDATTAIELAKHGFIVTMGIKPTRAEISYGYLKIDADADSAEVTQSFSLPEHCHRVAQFIEKPNLVYAEKFLQSEGYFWNSGIFFFSIQTLLNEMAQHNPNLLMKSEQCLHASIFKQKQNALYLDAKTLTDVNHISLDYALLEKTKRMLTVIGDFSWSDVGSWDALKALLNADSDGNRTVGESIRYQTTNCYIHNDYDDARNKRTIGTIGLDDITIVATDDALLVAKQDCLQDVKQLVEHIKLQDPQIVKYHSKVMRPWGYYTIVSENFGCKIKFLHVRPGAKLSLQLHHERSEHWIVIQGETRVTNGDQIYLLKANQSTFIPAGQKHRIENPGETELVMVEVQTGVYLGEDDIVRFEDEYERV